MSYIPRRRSLLVIHVQILNKDDMKTLEDKIRMTKARMQDVLSEVPLYAAIGVPIVGSFAAGFAITYGDFSRDMDIGLAIAPVPITATLWYNFGQGGGLGAAVVGMMTTGSSVIAQGAGLFAGYVAKNIG
jgi:hypothetical protein